MKLLLILVIISSSFSLQPSSEFNKIVLLFWQDKTLRPVAISKEEFWDSENYFDKIELLSQNLINKVERKIESFELENEEDLNYKAALIRYKNGVVYDTIYTDRFFQYWQINSRIYKDTSQFFKKLFVNFFDGQLK